MNHKRIYRIMKAAGLLLQRHTRRPNRTHDGKVITLHGDTRWCSDAFMIQCYIASTIGVDGSMVRDLMVETVEAFVKIFKRDYVWPADLSSSMVVMG